MNRPGGGMIALDPLDTLYDAAPGRDVPLSPELGVLYGPLRFPSRPGRPHVIGNFVATLDGVAALSVPGHLGGGPISGHNRHDHAVMGLLRAAADAVVVGAGTLRASPAHLWTAEHIFPPPAAAYRDLRRALGKEAFPLNVVVSASGEVDFGLPVFGSGAVPALVVTTTAGAARIRGRAVPTSVSVEAAGGGDRVAADMVLAAVGRVRACGMILVEGGPRLMADFFGGGLLDELFLTVAPQVAGRDGSAERPGIVAGVAFAPDRPVWGSLVGVKRGGSHLFLRYSFTS